MRRRTFFPTVLGLILLSGAVGAATLSTKTVTTKAAVKLKSETKVTATAVADGSVKLEGVKPKSDSGKIISTLAAKLQLLGVAPAEIGRLIKGCLGRNQSGGTSYADDDGGTIKGPPIIIIGDPDGDPCDSCPWCSECGGDDVPPDDGGGSGSGSGSGSGTGSTETTQPPIS